MRQAVKKFITNYVPFGEAYFNQRRNRHNRRFEESIGLPELASRYVAKNGLVVKRGLFQGLQYLPEATGSVYIPKLLGAYESEIYSFIQELVRPDTKLIIDIGCAEGYYAVGLARRYPQVIVHAFDADRRARQLCKSMAKLNDVSNRVQVKGKTTDAELRRLCGRQALLICDIDGAEQFVINLQNVPELRYTDMLIEFHDHIDPQISSAIIRQFEETHVFSCVLPAVKSSIEYPEVLDFTDVEQQKMLCEYRPHGQSWGVFTVKPLG